MLCCPPFCLLCLMFSVVWLSLTADGISGVYSPTDLALGPPMWLCRLFGCIQTLPPFISAVCFFVCSFVARMLNSVLEMDESTHPTFSVNTGLTEGHFARPKQHACLKTHFFFSDISLRCPQLHNLKSVLQLETFHNMSCQG